MYVVIDFKTVKAIADDASAKTTATSNVLQQFPKGPMGLTPDAVKVTPEFKAAKKAFDEAFAAERKVNAYMVKHHKKELHEFRMAERESRMAERLKKLEK